MGEIAEMMLDGTLCQCCGTFLGELPEDHNCETDFEPSGFPELCEDCQ